MRRAMHRLLIVLQQIFYKLSNREKAIRARVDQQWNERRRVERLAKRAPTRDNLIVSLTSYPPRFKHLCLTLKSLLMQTVMPEKLVLWVEKDDYHLLPEEVIKLQQYGLIIEQVSDAFGDLRSYRKIVPALEAFPNSDIVICDDDAYYWPSWLEGLAREQERFPHNVICYRAHLVKPGPLYFAQPYQEWEHRTLACGPSTLLFPTGLGGVLYPNGSLSTLATKRDVFTALAPSADDVWLWWMARLNGTAVRRVPTFKEFVLWDGSQESALWNENIVGGRNDKQIENMIAHFGAPWHGFVGPNAETRLDVGVSNDQANSKIA